MTDSPDQAIFCLLPQPEGRRRSFVTSSIVNLAILGLFIFAGMWAPKVVEQHYEETQLIAPVLPPPPMKIRRPRLTAPPRHEFRPKPVRMEAKLTAPALPHVRPQMAHTPQPRPALAAAMPALSRLVHPSMTPVHLGDTFGVKPNPNAVRPANIAALGNPYGGSQGPSVAPHGVVRSAGIGDSTQAGAGGGGGGGGYGGRVGSVGMPGYAPASTGPVYASAEPQSTSVEVLSKPPVQYPAEARQSHIEGDVVLSVTFLADGQVLVHGVLRGLGHGLDQEAIRVAQQIRFRPATVNGRPVNVTTRITIAFQLA